MASRAGKKMEMPGVSHELCVVFGCMRNVRDEAQRAGLPILSGKGLVAEIWHPAGVSEEVSAIIHYMAGRFSIQEERKCRQGRDHDAQKHE